MPSGETAPLRQLADEVTRAHGHMAMYPVSQCPDVVRENIRGQHETEPPDRRESMPARLASLSHVLPW